VDIASWPDSDVKQLAEEIARLGLEQNVYELEQFGLTIVRPDQTGAAELAGRAFERVCGLMEERNGVRPDSVTGATHTDVFVPSLYNFAHEGRVFEELIVHPVLLALVTHLVGRRCVLAASTVFMKGPATGQNEMQLGAKGEGLQLGLHADNVMHPEPFAAYAEICNASWLLSDYTKEGGALAFVPGSHRACRNPGNGEAVNRAVPVEAPAGSLVVWHGNTWHGSYPRLIPGLRTSIAFEFVRPYMARHEQIDGHVTQEMLDRNPERYGLLMGADLLQWGEEGPDYAKLVRRPFRWTVFS
jgi:ectoine hydroxylase-related dioxygenase (phytanoyl-CoA dioxygenase family)